MLLDNNFIPDMMNILPALQNFLYKRIRPTIHVVLVGLLVLEPQLCHGSRRPWPRPGHLWHPTTFSTLACLSMQAKHGQPKLLHGIWNTDAKQEHFLLFWDKTLYGQRKLLCHHIGARNGNREKALIPSFDLLNPDVFEARVLQTFQLCEPIHSTFCLKLLRLGFLPLGTIRDAVRHG